MTEGDERWIARLTPPAGRDVAALLGMSLAVDVWERHVDSLVVAASAAQLAELERRGMAEVDRWATQGEYEAQVRNRAATGDGAEPGPAGAAKGGEQSDAI
ncbi:hypothetical protein [Modestobacter altitudinis]|uniref:hypothetical protein n=1 Tax=Modestobacter altitudinis TaxID=2213158 RepID=UPI0015D348ED|nr:hypothetical protein [Modestobacter altitudinis]